MAEQFKLNSEITQNESQQLNAVSEDFDTGSGFVRDHISRFDGNDKAHESLTLFTENSESSARLLRKVARNMDSMTKSFTEMDREIAKAKAANNQ
ncbi:TIGR04197 family type VII secretion effector [Streptococcus oricebi]|uniref:TIGR04197 family type VII secretion effector n=1 Tax=Streptococcus oricebi TaxID=1547447 RepID=A0ABS5B595_9STRE|nr:TIGR04197 family type VII secretion effector [Streptococcus oricebi]MBP2624016.1 hypothetical protein [Streptococcus oricebi]